ncbi:hypothetical protein [Streptomyces scopuliridis]|uniref:hypothetical protein n=1 Tax=Streptomyces scopuliridis TaxID=452529 RepID=UPI00367F7C72
MSADLNSEAVPDGTFGGSRPRLATRNGQPVPKPRWTREEQDRHYADLADAIGAPCERPADQRRAA